MSSQPPRKRFKQSTIAEGFKRQSSKQGSQERHSEDIADESMTDRELRLKAAEKRREKNSPDFTPPHKPEGPNTELDAKEKVKNSTSEKGEDLTKNQEEKSLSEKTEEISIDKDETKTESASLADVNDKGSEELKQDSSEAASSIEPIEDSVPSSSQENNVESQRAESEGEPVAMGHGAAKLARQYTPPVQKRPVTQQRLRQSKGTPINQLKTYPSCAPVLEPLRPTHHHTVLFDTRHFTPGSLPKPFPVRYEDKWDNDHVKLPCSRENIYPVEVNGKKELKSRWKIIEDALKQKMTSSLDLQEAIFKYNPRYERRWDFSGLHYFFSEELEAEESRDFFKNTMPKIVHLALDLPTICTRGIPLLKRNHKHSVTMTQRQAACLLANAFFCTFPRRNASGKNSEYSSYPDINFNSLFMDMQRGKGFRKIEKMKCIVNYFRRVTEQMPTGILTFRRQCMHDSPDWDKSKELFTRLHVTAQGTIEDQGIGMLQVDFANKFIGGGALGNGSVQEEIRFMLCPEMIVSRLLTEMLYKHECLIMIGCERFSNYKGYSDSFCWAGDHVDETPRDDWGRLHTEVVAIDALVFHSYSEQFQDAKILRELNKAWCGFYKHDKPEHLPAVATGNWGCGAFGGDLQLKSLLQLMAATEAGRDVCYFTFSDCDLRDELNDLHQLLVQKSLTVGDVWQLLGLYKDHLSNSRRNPMRLFDFIHKQCKPSDLEMDSEPKSPNQIYESADSEPQTANENQEQTDKREHSTNDNDVSNASNLKEDDENLKMDKSDIDLPAVNATNKASESPKKTTTPKKQNKSPVRKSPRGSKKKQMQEEIDEEMGQLLGDEIAQPGSQSPDYQADTP